MLDGEIHTEGAVGVLLPPGSGATAVVSQGCRPVGTPMVVTKADHRVVLELAGRPALERLAELVGGLTEEDRTLARRGLHVGWVIDEHKERFERGDFLIRNLIGGNKEAGALVVAGPVEIGSTFQFQVRDAGQCRRGSPPAARRARRLRRPAVHLHRPRVAPLRPGRSRRRAGRRPHRWRHRGHVLCRRGGSGRRPQLRPRLHRLGAALPLTFA